MTVSFDELPSSLHGLFKAHRRDRSTFFSSASVPSSVVIAWKARSRSPKYWLCTLVVLTRPAPWLWTEVPAGALVVTLYLLFVVAERSIATAVAFTLHMAISIASTNDGDLLGVVGIISSRACLTWDTRKTPDFDRL